MKPKDYFSVLVGIGCTAGIWVGSLVGLFSIPNGHVYDFMLRLAPQERKPCEVLLLMADYQTRELGDDVWMRTVTELQEMGARQIIFSFLPKSVSRAFYEEAEKSSNVFLGRQKLREVEESRVPKFVPLPKQAEGLNLSVGPVGIPEPSHGINRTERTFWLSGKQSQESLVLMAGRERVENVPTFGDDFLINFSGRPGGIPKVDLSSLLNKTLVTEVVKGKSVIVGFWIPDRFAGLFTPINPDRPLMAPAEYHAFALDTLVAGRTIKRPGAITSLFLIGFVISLGLAATIALTQRSAMALMLLLGISTFVGAGFLLLTAGIWLPVVELLASLAAVLILTTWHRISERNQKARDFVTERSAQVMFGAVPESLFDYQDQWNQLVHLVNQTLPLEKTIFLEKVPEDHRVKEVVALNTALTDIVERRRDYERTPFATAIERGIPLKVDRFFKSVSPGEDQYIVPLSFGGTILGFWAFTVVLEQETDVQRLLPIISMFSAQFAELLYQRRERSESQKAEQGLLKSILGRKKRQDTIDRMVNLVAFLELRLALLESALDASGSASLLCDLFGRVLATNKRMKDLCERMSLAPFQLTALDILVKLTGKTATETRTILNRAILETGTINLPITVSTKDIETFFLMTVRSLKAQTSHSISPTDSGRYPFDLYGLLIEMQEVSERADLTRVKDRILEQGATRIEEGLQELANLMSDLEHHGPQSSSARKTIADLRMSRSALAGAIVELKTYIHEDGFASTLDYYPVDAVNPVNEAVLSLQRELGNKEIDVSVEGSSRQVLVQALPEELGQLIEALLRILVADAYENSIIRVRIVPRGLEVVYELAANGYGIPDEDFQRYLQNPALSESGDFETIGRLRSSLDLWKGDLIGVSEVGTGIRFTLRLIRSLLSP